MKPLMSNKCKVAREDLVLIEQGQVIKDQGNVSNISITSHISVPYAIKENDCVNQSVEHHCNYPSIKFVKDNVEIMDTVIFDLVSNSDMLTKLKSLNNKKATGCDNISPNMIKLIVDGLSSHIILLVNRCISEATCPDLLKRTKVTPFLRKMIQLKRVTIGQ